MGQSPARQAIYRGTRSGQNVSDGHAPTPRGTSMLAGSTGLGPTGHEQQARNDQPLNRGQSGMSTPSAERLTPLEPKEEFTIGQNGHETITNGGQQHMNPLLATNPAAEAAMAAVAGLRTQGGQPDRTPASGGAEAGDDDDDSDDEEPPALEESTDSDSDDDSNDQAAVEAAVMAERRRSARKLRDAERRLAELEAKMREQELQREREQKDALAEMVQKLNAKNDALQAELKVKQEPREDEITTEAAVRKRQKRRLESRRSAKRATAIDGSKMPQKQRRQN